MALADPGLNLESRGRRPRLSLKEEKKRFRPSSYNIGQLSPNARVAILTDFLRNPYAG